MLAERRKSGRMAMPAATTIITAANTQAGTFSVGQAKTRIAVATSANRAAGWSAGQKYRCIFLSIASS